MKTIYRFFPLLIIPFSFVFLAYHTGSPGGYSGSAGDGKDCTNCHMPGPATNVNGWITTDIPQDGYTPGETYTITATGIHPGVVRFGFELTAENSSNQKTGTLVITEPAKTKLTNASHAVTHTSGGIMPTGDSITWMMNWVAPDAGEGSVTFTAAFNAANGNGNDNGDVIYKSATTVQEMIPEPAILNVDPNHAAQGWEGTVTIFGENTIWLSGVFNVIFSNHDDSSQKLAVSNIQVQNDTELTVDVSVASDQTIGLYDVQVNSAKLENAFTVDITDGIEDNTFTDKVSIYPNPAKNFINIDLPRASDIKIFDLAGRQLTESKNTSTGEKIDISRFENGVYFVLVENNGREITKKFFKK